MNAGTNLINPNMVFTHFTIIDVKVERKQLYFFEKWSRLEGKLIKIDCHV
jgi:hypothetical protein